MTDTTEGLTAKKSAANEVYPTRNGILSARFGRRHKTLGNPGVGMGRYVDLTMGRISSAQIAFKRPGLIEVMEIADPKRRYFVHRYLASQIGTARYVTAIGEPKWIGARSSHVAVPPPLNHVHETETYFTFWQSWFVVPSNVLSINSKLVQIALGQCGGA